MHHLQQLLIALPVMMTVGCYKPDSPPVMPASARDVEDPPSAPPPEPGPCLELARELCKVARASCEATTADFLAVGLPDAACADTLTVTHLLAEMAPDQGGLAAEKIFDLRTSKHASLTEPQRERLSVFSSALGRQYQQIASDGSDDPLPRSAGLMPYAAWPVYVRASARAELRLGRRGPPDGEQSMRPGPELRRALEALAAAPPWDIVDPERATLLSLHADRQATWGSLMPVLAEARAAGYVAVGIATRDGTALRQMPLDLGPPSSTHDPAMVATLKVSADGYQLGDGSTAVSTAADLRELARAWVDAHPGAGIVRLEASSDATLQHIVTGLDAVAACRIDPTEALVPEGCLLWHAFVDVAAHEVP